MTSARLIMTTAGSEVEAERLASALVAERLAACVNVVGPIQSHYWWRDQPETATEHLLLIKTTAEAVERVGERIRSIHSYELPEFIVLNLESGDAQYLAWIAGSVRKP